MTNFVPLDCMTTHENLTDDMDMILSHHGLSLSTQLCLTDVEENSYNVHRGIGSLVWDWTNSGKTKKDRILKESNFKFLCNQFKNTIFEDIYNQVAQEYRIGRARFMRLAPGTSMSWHTDDTFRIHYPMQTQEGCFMVIENELCHLKQDRWYWTNTKKLHTAFNASEKYRTHLVFCVL